jgi:uncharacterized protein YprB with RNaseH-like and TPR domain
VTPPPVSDQQTARGVVVDRELALAQLRASLKRLAARHAAERRPPVDPLTLETLPTPHGPALRRTETVRVPAAVAAAVPPGPGTVFLDTETTGLAGGTGTYVFLVGLATWSTARTLTVTQYFLGELGAEAAFLHAVEAAVRTARELVTFNGRTFDLPLLETRYLLARGRWWGADLPHQDLYPVARALWRGRAADCRLSTLEGTLLGLDRGDDLPGALVPQVYFRYLRSGDTGSLPRVFRHNSWDLIALAGLHARAAALLDGPDPRHDPVEWMGAGRWLERRAPDRSARFYEAALRAGLPDALGPGVAWRLGWLWRRAGRLGDARALWADAVARADRPPLRLLIDLAKLHEHHARDYGAALDLTRAALAAAEAWELVGADFVDALERRAHRLTRRLARAAMAAGALVKATEG